jgi:hypothetical protein
MPYSPLQTLGAGLSSLSDGFCERASSALLPSLMCVCVCVCVCVYVWERERERERALPLSYTHTHTQSRA